MSAQPHCTTILIKDLPFQAKYSLTHSQMDLMAYLSNVSYWAIKVEGDYSVILTSKIMSDLPAMGLKTIEASLKVLKDLELIECKMVDVPKWRGNKKHRGMRLTPKGKEYNGHIVLPSQDEYVQKLKAKIKELEETVEILTVSEEETSVTKKRRISLSMPTVQAIELFINTIKTRFGQSNQPICNGVPTWDKETTFYINSYNKLSIVTPQGKHIQLKDPSKINHFWEWLSMHTQRVGDKIDFKKTPTIKELEKIFLNEMIVIGKKQERIYEFIEVKKGVKIKVESLDGKIRSILDSTTQKEKVFGFEECWDVLFTVLYKS